MVKTLRDSWAVAYDPTTDPDRRTAQQVLLSVEQARADAEDRRIRREKEAQDYVVSKLDDECRKLLSHAVRFRKAIGAMDSSILGTARLLLGEDRDLLVRQAKAYAASTPA